MTQETLTPAQREHIKRIQRDALVLSRSLDIPKPASARAIVVLFMAAWFRYASLAHPEWSKEDAIREFNERQWAKYEKGVLEHGGNLWQKPGMLEMLAEEIIDGVAYASTAAEQEPRRR